MKFQILFLVLVSGSAANAHPGHLIDLAGHGHWLAGIALGGAIAAGIWGALKGNAKDTDEPEEVDEDQPQEA